MNARTSIFLFLLLSSVVASAQPYENAVGIRAGYSSGLNYKHITNDDLVIEAKGLYNRHGFQFTGLLAYQFSPYDKKRLFYYAGGGIFGGNWEEEAAVGAALVIGSEYVFRDVPLAIGLEWKPMLNIFKTYLKPDGEIYLAHDAKRQSLPKFLNLAQKNFDIGLKEQVIKRDGKKVTIVINRLRHKKTD